MYDYYPPKYHSKEFHCPHCNTYAHQLWTIIDYYQIDEEEELPAVELQAAVEVQAALCFRCKKSTFWLSEEMIYPLTRIAPPANSDLPDEAEKIYEEAADIASRSPRAACALLRLALEILIKGFGEGGTLNENIRNLESKGVDERTIRLLDIVRIVGNNAIHPGQIDIEESVDVQLLFRLINRIAHQLITEPKETDELYNLVN